MTTDPGHEWFPPGHRLGEYTVVRRAWREEFAAVLEAEGDGHPWHVVVHLPEDASPERTLAVLRAWPHLEHASLPRIIHVGEPCSQSHGRVWYVREPLPAALSAGLEAIPLATEEVLAIGRALCDLLQYLHDGPPQLGGKPLVHGFLRSMFVHRTEQGTIKVTGLNLQMLARAGVEFPDRFLAYRSPSVSTLTWTA